MLDWLKKARVMGILNLTPDSFSDGGLFNSIEKAVQRGRQMVEQGADIIDVGGESTRPGALPISAEQEIERVVPVIKALKKTVHVPISIDTSKPEVMQAAVSAGADMINDVRALRLEGALHTAARLKVPVCLMHMQGQPSNMQDQPYYEDVVQEVADFLQKRAYLAEQAGIDSILIDPGFGFGKSFQHNQQLMRHLSRLNQIGYPVLVGLSRKSMLGQITGRAVEQRTAASLAAAILAVQKGAQIVRVHDVAETVDALKTIHALQ